MIVRTLPLVAFAVLMMASRPRGQSLAASSGVIESEEDQLEREVDDPTAVLTQLKFQNLYTPRNFQISCLTPLDLNVSAVPQFRGTGPLLKTLLRRRGLLDASVDLSLTVPQEVMVSVYREVTERLALLGNINWQNWSQFGQVDISVKSVNPKTLTQNLQYDDTWQLAAGAQYKVSPAFMISAGFAYDSYMVSDSNRTVSAPVGAQYRYPAGAQHLERAPHDRPFVRV